MSRRRERILRVARRRDLALLKQRTVLALLIAVVVAGIGIGLMIIVATGFGKEVTFDTIYPTITDK